MTEAQYNKLVAEERARLAALRLQLLESHPFWGYLLLQMNVVFQRDMPSFAATDCYRTIWFNPLMTRFLSIRQLGFVLLHEIGHSVFASMERRHGRNQHLWNCATDYAINRIIMEIPKPGGHYGRSLYELPEVDIEGRRFKPLFDMKYRGMIAEMIYERLAADELQDPTMLILKLKLPGGQGGDNDETGDDNSAGGSGNRDDELEIPDVMDHHGGIDVHIPVDLDPARREVLTDRIRAAIATWQQSGGKGNLPAGSVGHLLPGKKSSVPWPRLLRQFAGQALAKDDYSLARPNKRYLSHDIVVPGLYSESLNQVVIALDTSGSMNVELLSIAMAEIARLKDLVSEALLLVGDCKIHEVVPMNQLQAYVKNLRVKGGGGTSHLPVFKYIAEKHLEPDLFIGLSDLESTFPEKAPRFPVLWVTPPDPPAPPWGRVIEIDDEQE